MTDLPFVVLEAEPDLPMTTVGWGVLLVSLLVAAAWLAYLYR